MPKQLMFDVEARTKILAGLAKLTDAVKVTLGPTGKHVLLQKSFGGPVASKDGVTVAKDIELADPFENIGAKLAQEAAQKTADEAGDGTTTSTVLLRALIEEGARFLAAGANPMRLRQGIHRAAEKAVEELKGRSTAVRGRDDYLHVATISANNDAALGALIADAMEKTGKEGIITVEEGRGRDTILEFAEGLDFDKGYISPYFISNLEKLTTELEDPYILLCERKISNLEEFVPLLESVARTGKPLLVVAEEVEGEALAALVVNKMRGVLNACAVKAPAFGDRRKAVLQDVAILTGARVVSDDLGTKLESLTLEDLGRAKKVKVEKERTCILEGAGDRKAIAARMDQIRTQMRETTSDYDREKFEERLAKLRGGVAILRIGAATETEMKEKKSRVEDAVHAAKAAAQEGTGTGGGVSFLRVLPAVEALVGTLSGDEALGARCVAKALEAPFRQIVRNTGRKPAAYFDEVRARKDGWGYNALTGRLEDLNAAGILDATQVLRTALENAASIAGTLLTTEGIVTELKEKTKAVAGSVK